MNYLKDFKNFNEFIRKKVFIDFENKNKFPEPEDIENTDDYEEPEDEYLKDIYSLINEYERLIEKKSQKKKHKRDKELENFMKEKEKEKQDIDELENKIDKEYERQNNCKIYYQ